jgi:hypothetical protein
MDYTIRQLFEKVLNGQIRIPSFQRGFVWEPDKVAYLMDSIYKGYPFGNLLFWRTKEILKSEREIGSFPLIAKEDGLPIDYVLDGQQRITSIFAVFQTEIKPKEILKQFNIYFDFSLIDDAQEAQFFALDDNEVDLNKHFPLYCLFDSVRYREATNNLDKKTVAKIDLLQTRFKEAHIPVQFLETEDKTKVSIVFERINRKGVELDTFQLLNAWTWSDNFDLRKCFEELQQDLEPFGFQRVGEDVDLLLRCGAAILAHNASAKSLIDLKGNEVRDRFKEIINGIKGSIDFLKTNLKVEKLTNLPYSTILIPLSAFFAVKGRHRVTYNDDQRKKLVKWFWRTCYSKRYSSGVVRNLNKDITEALRLRNGHISELGAFHFTFSPDYYTNNAFRTDPVSSKTFALQLAQNEPLSFITGSPVSLRKVLQEYNSNEFHHIFPRAYLKLLGKNEKSINCLANFCILSKSDNNKISGDKPSVYLQKLPNNTTRIFKSAFIPESISMNNFEKTIKERCELLWKNANKLMGVNSASILITDSEELVMVK